MKAPATKRPRPFACSLCGKSFTIETAASNHARSVDCARVRTREAYAARGWARAYSWGGTLLACGFPVERAPTHAAIVARSEAPKPWCYGRGLPGDLVEIPNEGPWAPGYAVAAAYLFADAKITAEQRREAILRAVEDQEFAEACAAVKALGGKEAVAVLVRKMRKGARPHSCPIGGGEVIEETKTERRSQRSHNERPSQRSCGSSRSSGSSRS